MGYDTIFIFLLLLWGSAGAAAAAALPKIRPHLLYLAAYFSMCVNVIYILRILTWRGIYLVYLSEVLLFVLPWGGVGLAFWWRRHPLPLPGADPLKKRLALFGGMALGLVLFWKIVGILTGNDILSLNADAFFGDFYLLTNALAIALFVPRLLPARRGIIFVSLTILVTEVFRVGIFFIPGLYDQIYPLSEFIGFYSIFLPSVAVFLALLGWRKAAAALRAQA